MYPEYDPLGDGKSSIQMIGYMGGDLDIVNAARVSFNNSSESLTEKDKRLIHYLIKNEHTSPLRGTVFKFKVSAPIFVIRQWVKHQVASSHTDEQHQHNEVSFRYTKIVDPQFYIPDQFLQQSENNKQASGEPLDSVRNQLAFDAYQTQCNRSANAYKELIDLGVSRELARGILVPAVYSSWIWTVSLQALLHFITLREGQGAQSEIKKYAEVIKTIIEPIVPVAMEAWKKYADA